MTQHTLDLGAYADRIGLEGPLEPTHDTLARLVAAHASAIPFENVEVLAGRVPRLDAAALEANLVRRRRGGYCFDKNGFLLAVLRQAGFVAHGLEARVRTGVPADVTTARTHMAVRVTLDGEDWLADVGFGAHAPTAPLRLAERGAQRDPQNGYRLLDVEHDRLLQCLTHEGWS